jgi:Ricin-type beta-trefoil lectin domain
MIAIPLAIVLAGLIAYQATDWLRAPRAGQAAEPTVGSTVQLPSVDPPSASATAAATASPIASTASPTPARVTQAPVPIASTPASPGGALDGTGEILGLGGQCLDNNSSTTSDGNPVQVWPCNGTAAEVWSVANDRFSVQGKCMAVRGTTDGTNVVLWTCDGSPGQIWQANPTDHTVRNPASGLCLTAPNTYQQVIIATCSNADGQKWTHR